MNCIIIGLGNVAISVRITVQVSWWLTSIIIVDKNHDGWQVS